MTKMLTTQTWTWQVLAFCFRVDLVARSRTGVWKTKKNVVFIKVISKKKYWVSLVGKLLTHFHSFVCFIYRRLKLYLTLSFLWHVSIYGEIVVGWKTVHYPQGLANAFEHWKDRAAPAQMWQRYYIFSLAWLL